MAEYDSNDPANNPDSESRPLIAVDFSKASPDTETPAQDEKQNDIADQLGAELNKKFESWRESRQQIEIGWITDLRQFNGIYEPEILAKLGNRSKVFVRLTRTKTLGAYSRIIDLLLGRDRHWSIGPTPIPELTPESKQELMQEIFAIDPQAQDIPAEHLDELLLDVEKDLAEKAGEKMQTQIDDQLVDEKYDSLFKTAAMESCLLGTGCIKGPVVKISKSKAWRKDPSGAYQMVEEEKSVPGLTAPSIFDLYPDPFCTSLEDGVGIYERHIMIAQHLRGLKNYDGFNPDAIEKIISYYPRGNHVDLQHEKDRRDIASQLNTFAQDNRFDVLEYWGQVTGQELQNAGMEIHVDRLTTEVQANVWFCGSCTLKTQLNPLTPERLPYQFARYEKIPHQFWGIGVPRQMVDSQDMMNSGVRTMLDNEGISSGPMYEVNLDMIEDGEDPRDLYPWKGWLRRGGDPAHPMIRFYQPNSNINDLVKVVEMFRKFMDEETSQPSYTHGDAIPGLNKTASGMSMLMGAANISTKGVIKNWDDDMIAPTMRGMYDWNMRWNPRKDIKRDMQVEARGSTALLAKEIQSQRLMQYAEITNNPNDAALLGPERRAKLLREICIALDLNPDEVGPDDEQFNASQQGIPGNVPPGGGVGVVSNQPPAVAGAPSVPGAPA